MQLNRLKPAVGSISKRKRIGRGQGSGKGGTSTKGHKGAQSRSGYKRKAGFEGGQLPLQRRIPKGGFKSLNKIIYKPINLQMLKELVEKYSVTRIDALFLQQHGFVKKYEKYKILGKSELNIRLDVFAHAFSIPSMEQIVKAGGTTTILGKHA